MMNFRVSFSFMMVLMGSTCLLPSTTLATSYTTSDTIKSGLQHNLKFNGAKYLTGSDSGILTINEIAGTVNYQDRVQNAAGTGGYDLLLNWKIVSLDDLLNLGYGSAPRCAKNGGVADCNGPYYTNNGIDPTNDWLFLLENENETNSFTGWGTLEGINHDIITKWGQFGDGAGGVHVLPEGLALGVWFDGGADLNVNASMPEPSSFILLGSGIAALVGWGRHRRQGRNQEIPK